MMPELEKADWSCSVGEKVMWTHVSPLCILVDGGKSPSPVWTSGGTENSAERKAMDGDSKSSRPCVGRVRPGNPGTPSFPTCLAFPSCCPLSLCHKPLGQLLPSPLSSHPVCQTQPSPNSQHHEVEVVFSIHNLSLPHFPSHPRPVSAQLHREPQSPSPETNVEGGEDRDRHSGRAGLLSSPFC